MHAAMHESNAQLDGDTYCLPCRDTLDSPDSLPLETSPAYTINHLTRDQLRILWHQRLGHLHNRRMKLVVKAAVGVPEIATDDELNKCPICMAAKLRKANKGTEDSRHATICNQGISIDAGFIVQSSKDSERMRRYT
jgi:GAG-pre-integrase domain